MSRRQSIAERARQEAVAKAADLAGDDEFAGADDEISDGDQPSESDVAARTGHAEQALFDDEVLNAKLAKRAQRTSRGNGAEGVESRPARRRDVADNDESGESGESGEAFPWHFQFDEDDEPEDLKASTPLLSRAFRASTG